MAKAKMFQKRKTIDTRISCATESRILNFNKTVRNCADSFNGCIFIKPSYLKTVLLYSVKLCIRSP